MKIERFEDIQAWQKARSLNQMIYEVTKRKPFSTDFALRDQLRRAAISIMLNIAEGFGRWSNREIRQFFYIAHGSVAEVQAGLYIALDQGYVSQNEFKTLYDEAEETSKIIAGFMGYLNTLTS